MKVLLIGGTGFIGPFVVRDLAADGHQVAVFHRGQSRLQLPVGVMEIRGDRRDLVERVPDFRRFAPDVVLDIILASELQAATTMEVFRGIAGRVVALSSGDVYRATAILHRIDNGPLQPMPLTEESDLRTKSQPYTQEVLEMLHKSFPWLENDYDKIPVERVILSDGQLPGTVLRLPMTYGPGDKLHRLYPYLKRMDDGRPAILMEEQAASWRGPRGYVENVAAAIVLAITSQQAAGRIYNVADEQSPSEREWVENVGRIAGWNGSVVAVPNHLLPVHLRTPANYAQHWIMSSARIRQELGFVEPLAPDVALQRTIAWERANPQTQLDPAQFDYAAEDAALSTR